MLDRPLTMEPHDERRIRQRLHEIEVLLEKLRQHPEASALRTALIASKATFEKLLAAESSPEEANNQDGEEGQ